MRNAVFLNFLTLFFTTVLALPRPMIGGLQPRKSSGESSLSSRGTDTIKFEKPARKKPILTLETKTSVLPFDWFSLWNLSRFRV